jgi:hypothetical protein
MNLGFRTSAIDPAQHSRNRSESMRFTAEAQSTQRFLISKNSLRVLRASALKIVADPSSGGSVVNIFLF